MLKLNFGADRDHPLKITCFGAHSDDIEIGCGGTILRLLSEYGNVEVTWVVLGAIGIRKDEAITSARKFIAGSSKQEIVIEGFKDGYFPYVGGEIKDFFEAMKKRGSSPDLIFTHYRHDLHQDHRVVSDLTWNTYRDHLILEYEIMKYDGDMGNPNFFVRLDRKLCSTKVTQMLDAFKSQADHRWFTQDTFWSMLRLRGVECNAPEGYAEAFHSRKLLI